MCNSGWFKFFYFICVITSLKAKSIQNLLEIKYVRDSYGSINNVGAIFIALGLEAKIAPTLLVSLFAPYKGWTNGWRVPLVWLRMNQWLKSTTSLVNQTSGILSPLVILYMAWKGRLSFQCGTLQVKNDYKCNT